MCHSRYDRKDNLRTHIRKNHSNVVDPDTVELNSIDNDGQIDIKPRNRRQDTHEATINPETREMEGGPPASDMSMRAMMDRQSLVQRSHNQVHVAHDLLSLKYGEDGGQGAGGGGPAAAGQFRGQVPTPDIKHEIGAVRFDPSSAQIPQWHIKVERPDLASQMMGLQRAVSSMAASAASSVRMAVSQGPPSPRDPGPGHHPGAAHMHMAGAGYTFQHHNL